ncbi:hypothetical protein WJX81_002985 [Elliptochloris bilobata]|uniref:AFG1-like ATPase n=1 Tax=Elliptochloris bilobata TaxID=381761 RepID=A0AAW1SEI8_9CHLO
MVLRRLSLAHPAEAGPLAQYRKNRFAGVYRKDPRQETTVLALQRLYEELCACYCVGRPRRRGSGLTLSDHVGASQKEQHAWWQSIFGGRSSPAHSRPPRGLYMWGGVGTGKTMLMDLLAASAPPEFQLRRLTFHEFMLHEVHGRLFRHQHIADPLAAVADRLMCDMRVLCLDEFFVTDVADATILARLFGYLWDRGLVLVATSNRAPEGLYKNGLQRDLFLPFIDRLGRETRVHDISSSIDYRRLAHHSQGLYFTPGNCEDPHAELAASFRMLAAACLEDAAPARVQVAMGRHLDVPHTSGGVCMFTFEELCGRPVAAADYIALANRFHTVAVEGVPEFSGATRSQAYRFLTLVDVLYEHRVRLVCSAAVEPTELFTHIHTQAESREQAERGEADDPRDVVDDNLGFSKDRCVSRLTDMQSLSYLTAHARKHSPNLLLALEEVAQKAEAVGAAGGAAADRPQEPEEPSMEDARAATMAATG